MTQSIKTGMLRLFTALLAIVLTFGALQSTASAATSDNTFTFSNSSISVSGSGTGYEIDGTSLKITEAGTYTITGSCTDGSVTVKKEVTGVTLILSDLTLACSTTAPITCNKSSEVTIEVTGTTTLTDNETDDTLTDYEGAAIKVKSGASLDLTGSGTLIINGSNKNGIKGAATASITVSSLTLTITAENNALASDGSVLIQSGTLSLTSGNDAIKAEPETDDTESAGTVTITGGTITIVSQGDGIQATGAVTITDGTFDIKTGGGYQATLGDDDSAKGIKSSSTVSISGGTYTMNCADDAIHSNNEVSITDGTFSIATGDDGVHADYTLNLGTKGSTTGPSITISSCYEGLEAAVINLYSGNASIVASDDGINAASSDLGNDYAFSLNVYDGTWIINADGDGLDSNRDIYFYGGTVEVFGAANSGDAAIDYDGSCYYIGGTVIGIGMSGMAEAPSSGIYVAFGSLGMMGGGGAPGGEGGGFGGGQDGEAGFGGMQGEPPTGDFDASGMTGERPQMGDMENMGEMGERPDGMGGMDDMSNSTFTISSGSSIEVKDSTGTTLYSTTGLKSANSVVFAHESVVSGSEYTLYIDGVVAETATATEGTGSGNNNFGGNGQGSTSNGLFSDVSESNWYYSAVKYVYDSSIMSGTSQNAFSPNGTLSRAMLAQILYNLEDNPTVSSSAGFSDVSNDQWYAAAINWAAENDLVTGYSDGSFAPNAAITREQMATLMYRYASFKGYSVDATADLSTYSDKGSVSAYAETALQWANGTGLITGTDSGALQPRGNTTRAQAATILMRFCEQYA